MPLDPFFLGDNAESRLSPEQRQKLMSAMSASLNEVNFLRSQIGHKLSLRKAEPWESIFYSKAKKRINLANRTCNPFTAKRTIRLPAYAYLGLNTVTR